MSFSVLRYTPNGAASRPGPTRSRPSVRRTGKRECLGRPAQRPKEGGCLLLLAPSEAGERALDSGRVAGKDLGHQPLARFRQGRIPRPAIVWALLPLHQPSLHQTIDEEGDPPARHQDFALHLAQEERPFVEKHLEDAEFGKRQIV